MQPHVRLLVAQDLISGGGISGDVSVAVLDMVQQGDGGQGLDVEIVKLRGMVDEAYSKKMREEWDVVKSMLEAAGVSPDGLPQAMEGIGVLSQYICTQVGFSVSVCTFC